MACNNKLNNWTNRKIRSWSSSRHLNGAQVNLASAVIQSQQGKIDQRSFRTKVDAFKRALKDQVKLDEVAESFQRIYTANKVAHDSVAEMTEYHLKELRKHYKKDSQEAINATKYLLETGYNSIKGWDEKTATQFMKQYDDIYQLAKKHIDQGAKAIGDESEQVGAYLNNAMLIADHSGLPRSTSPIIARMMSVKAMTPDAWKYVEANKNTDGFKLVMDMVSENKRRSQKLFAGNPDRIVNNYIKEVYTKNKRITKGGKVVWDAESAFEQGAITIKLENKKVGRYNEDIKGPNMSTAEQAIKFAEDNRLKMFNGQHYRRVATREMREEAGRSMDISDILSETTGSIGHKEAVRETADTILKELSETDGVISTHQKKGYRELTAKEAGALPYQLRTIKYVHESYDKRVLGRDEIRLARGDRQITKIADRLLADLVRTFKQNVVIKNIKSHVNAVLFNQAIGGMAGMSPTKLIRYQKEAAKAIKQTDMLKRNLAKAKSTGRQTKNIQRRLDQNELYQMEKAGLSINLLEGVKEQPALMTSMFFRNKKWVNEFTMGSGSYLGTKLTNNFSLIDTQGRYALTKHYMDKGDNLTTAVHKANGLFADMDQMAPTLIEMADKYGGMKFMKWFIQSTPMLLKLTKDNPIKAVAVGATIYALQEATNTNFTTVNPIEAMADFADSSTELELIAATEKDGYEPLIKKLAPYVLPKPYMDAYNYIDYDNYDLIFKDRAKGERRGPVQKLIEGDVA